MSLADDIAAAADAQPSATQQQLSLADQISAAANQPTTAVQPGAPTASPSLVAGNNFFQNAQLGIGHGMVSSAEHIKQGIDESADWLHSKLENTPIGAGLDWIGQKTGLPTTQQVLAQTNQNIADTNRLDAPIMATTGGKIGNLIGQAGVAAPTILIPGVNTYTGAALAGAGTGLAMTAGGLSDRLMGAGYGALGGLAGKGLGDLIGAGATKLGELRSANLAAQQAQNQTRDAAVKLALQSGYKLPPQEVNPGALNGLLEGLSGKIKTSQSASAQNQSLTNSLVKADLGIGDDVPLTPQTLQGIRAQAGKAYQAVKGAGTISADAPYMSKLDSIAGQYDKASQSFPGFAKPEITNLVNAFKQPNFDAGSAIDAIGMLRDQGNAAFRSGDTALAKAHTGVASALEDVIDRNLQSSADPSLLNNYRDARQMIAKTYSVERALNPATGDVNAADLAKQLQKGKPLSGNLKTVGTVASAFPKATQALKQNYNPVSPLDYAMGLIGAVHNPLEGAAVLARPAVRSMILGKPYQALNALGSGNYGGGLVSNAIYPALASRPLSDFLRVGGPVAAVQSQQ